MAENDPVMELLAAASNSPEMLYVKMYHETIDALNSAIAKYDVIATSSSDAGVRTEARSRYLQALQAKHMADEAYYAWENGGAVNVSAPSQEMVNKTIELARQLAAITTSEKELTAIVDLFTGVASAFNSLHGQPAPVADVALIA